MVSKSKKLFDQAKKIIPSGVNSPVRFFKPYPFFVKKSQGSSIWDEDGSATSITVTDMVHCYLGMQERK